MYKADGNLGPIPENFDTLTMYLAGFLLLFTAIAITTAFVATAMDSERESSNND